MAKAPKNITSSINVGKIEMQECSFNVLSKSKTPMIMNRFAQKAWQELLLPSNRRNQASLEQTLKHDPVAEFRGAVYLNRDPKRKALIHVPNGAFHKALAAVAIDMPGARKAQIERLTKVVDINIDLYGIPNIFCAMVRNSDMNHTPDVRTRPIFPEWACRVTFEYVTKIITHHTIGNLFGAAGQIIGIGDWRGAKGGSYGSFRLVPDGDPDFDRIVKTQGRAAQQHALDHPIYFDEDTEELLTWFEREVSLREKNPPSASNPPSAAKRVIIENGSGDLANAAALVDRISKRKPSERKTP
jgi:hypothetical protein